MSKAFIKGNKDNFPNAEITFDRFHVMKIVNNGVDKVRKEESKELKILSGTKYIFLKNPNNLTKKQKEKLEEVSMSKLNIKTFRAYNIKQSFQDIYTSETEEEFIIKLNKWYFWATHSRLEPMKRVAKSIKNHWDGIVNWKKTQINNGILEGLNSVIQAAKSKARGYSTTENFKIIVYLLTGKLDFKLINTAYEHL